MKQKQIQTLYQIQVQNEIDLKSKARSPSAPRIDTVRFKKPQTLYDSGWISCTGSGDPDFRFVSTPEDWDAYGQLDYYHTQSARCGTKMPMNLYYHFMKDVSVPEELLPFVNASFLMKCPATMEPTGFRNFKEVLWGSNYYEIHAGGNLVYKGYDPYTYYHSDTEINRGDLPRANCSKWYEGVLEYNMDGDHYQIYGDLQYIGVYYDAQYVSEAQGYNYKYFFTQTFDNISGSSVTGQGTHQTWTWKETSPGSHSWYPDLVMVHEIHKTMNILGAGNTVIVAINGSMFKNGVYQNGYQFWLKTAGTYDPGTATITSWNFTHKTVYEDTNDKLYKLHYSSRRLRQVMIDSYPEEYCLTNLPDSSDIDVGSSLPFTSASIKVNPDPYPLAEESSFYESTSGGGRKQLWARVSPKDARKEIWRFFLEGNMYFMVPVTLDIGFNKPFVDESYSYNGYGFQRDAKNRPDKRMPAFMPDTYTVQIRLILTLTNPKSYGNIQRYR